MVSERHFSECQHAKKLLEKSEQTITVRAGRDPADVREAFDAQQPAASEVHAVHAELLRGMGEGHRRRHRP